MVTMFVHNDMKKPERKKRSESRDIDENKSIQWLGETFGNIRPLATERRRIPFYDVIGDITGSNKRLRQRQFEKSQNKSVLKKMIHGMIWECTELLVLSKTASCLWYNAYKKDKNGNSARHTCFQLHMRPSICYGGSDNFSSKISGKIPKIATSHVISQERLIVSPRILHDNQEDQAQWYISKRCSLY